MEGAATFLCGDMLPTNENVVEFVLARSKSNFSLLAATNEMATAVHEIWQTACPLSVPAIKHRYQLLFKERSSFMTKTREQWTPTPNPTPTPKDSSEFTRKHT